MAYAWRRTITIDHTKVTANQVNFPVLVTGTFSDLALVASGGVILNSSGFDRAYYSDSGLTTLLDFEVVKWVSTTGEIVDYIRIASLSSTVDTVFYMGYSNASIVSSLQNKNGVWDANFACVVHGGDGVSVNLNDSTSNGNNLTNINAATAIGGLFGGGISVNGTTQYAGRSAGLTFTGKPLTHESLFYPTASGVIIGLGQAAVAGQIEAELNISGTNVRALPNTGAAAAATSSGSFTSSAWNYAGGYFNTTTDRGISLNGSADNTSAVVSTDVVGDELSWGARHTNGGTNNFFTGRLMELRVSTSVRSNSWRVTTYNSLIGFATFLSIGGATSIGPVAQVVINSQPTTTVSGVNISAFTARVTTDGSTTDITYQGNITVSKPTGVGTLGGTTVYPCVNGVTSINATKITLTTNTSNHTLRFAAPSYTSVDSNAFSVTQPVQTRIENFITNTLGVALANCLCWKDFRVNATPALWDDVRGAGAGKLSGLVQATVGNQGIINSDGFYFVASSQQHMISNLDSILDLSLDAACHLLVWMRSPSANSFLVSISADPTDITNLPYMGLTTNGTNYGMQANPGPSSTTNQLVLDCGVSFSSIVRTLFISKAIRYTSAGLGGPGDREYRLQSGGMMGRSQMSLPVANTPASGMKHSIARLGTTYADCIIQAIAVFNIDLTNGARTSIEAFGESEYSSIPTLTKVGSFMVVDDSKNRGHNSSHPKGFKSGEDGTTAWPVILASNLGLAAKGWDTYPWALDRASNGRQMTDTVAVSRRFDLEINNRRSGPNILICSPFNGSVVLEAAYSGVGGDIALQTAFLNWATARNTFSPTRKLIVYTCTDLLQFYTPNGTGTINQSGLNALLMTTWVTNNWQTIPGCVGYIDFANSPLGGTHFQVNRAGTHANQDPIYYDGTSHPTDVGQALLATIATDFFNNNPKILNYLSSNSVLSYSLRRRRRY